MLAGTMGSRVVTITAAGIPARVIQASGTHLLPGMSSRDPPALRLRDWSPG